LHSADAAAAVAAGTPKKGDEKSQNESQRRECKFHPTPRRMMSCSQLTMTLDVAL